ncbi:MAG: hypothetical protein FJ096_11620 [Deltaproteobacteria bacterium]|nr:hypothetical protein [Deltaproteobacteria bacterium]
MSPSLRVHLGTFTLVATAGAVALVPFGCSSDEGGAGGATSVTTATSTGTGGDDCSGETTRCEVDGKATCVTLATDPANCGACGNVCAPPVHATAGCAMGACGIGQCGMGWGDCDMGTSNGCETELLSNDAHCGACGNACTLTTRCKSGWCEAYPLKLLAKLDHATEPAPASLVAGGFRRGRQARPHHGEQQLGQRHGERGTTVSVLRDAACLP